MSIGVIHDTKMLIPKEILGITRRRLQRGATRRKLYNVEYVPIPTTMMKFPSMVKDTSVHQTIPNSLTHINKEDPKPKIRENKMNAIDAALERLIKGGERIKESKSSIMNDSTQLRKLPLKLQQSLRETSDPHVKLGCLLDYPKPLRVKTEFVQDILTSQLKIKESVELHDALSQGLLMKLVKFYVINKQFNRSAEVMCSVGQSIGLTTQVDLISSTIFEQLASNHDLKFGFMDMMRSIYHFINKDYHKFKFHYKNLTQGEHFTSVHGVNYDFEDVWKMVQLEYIIDQVDNISELPRPYWETGYDYIDLRLGMKCFKQGDEVERGFAHLKRRKVMGQDGVIYRIIDCCHQNNRTGILDQPSSIEGKIYKVITANPERIMSEMDIEKLRGFTKNNKMLKAVMKNMSQSNSVFEVKNMYMKKMLSMGQLRLAVRVVEKNMDQVYKFDVQLLATLMSSVRDFDLLKDINNKLPAIPRSFFLSALLKRELKAQRGSSRESRIPENQFRGIAWVLDSVDYKLSDANFIHIAKLLQRLPIDMQRKIIEKIQGPEALTFVRYLASGKPLSSTLVPALINTNKVRTRDELINLSNYIAKFCSTDEIIYILDNVNDRYESLHEKITIGLCHDGEFGKCEQVLKAKPHEQSIFYLNRQLVSNQQSPKFKEAYDKEPDELMKLKTIERLLDNTKLGYSSTLRRNMSWLMKRNKVDGNMALLLLKKVVKKIRSNGPLHATDRLKYSLELCVRYRVPKSSVIKVLEST